MIDRRARFWQATLVWLAAACCAGNLVAQQSRPTSLDIVPADAAFYWASMNHAAQYQAVVNSNAYQQLMDTHVAKNMRKAYRNGRRRGFDQFGWDNPFAQYLQGYSETLGSVPGKMAMTFLKEIFGNEVFIYADKDWNKLSDAVGMAYLRVVRDVISPGEFAEFGDEQLALMMPILREELEGVNTPVLVMGTVLDEPARIESLLQMAEAGIEQLMLQIPPDMEYVAEAFEVIERDDAYLLTLNLTADMVPWESLESDPFFLEHGDDLKALLRDKSIAVTFGIKGQYLLASVGPTNEHLLSLGEQPLLVDQAKLRPLKEMSNQPLTGVTYVSDEVMQRNRDFGALVDYLVYGLEVAIRDAAEPGTVDELLEMIRADAEELKTDLAHITPRAGTYLAFSYLNEQGIGGFVYDWSENKYLDDSQPLQILQHVGRQPALVLAGRERGSEQQYQVARKWASKLFGYAQDVVPQFIEDEPVAYIYQQALADLRPILQRLEVTTREEFLPATSNGEFAILLDFSHRKSSWHAQMPPAEFALPLPALAIIMQVKDREKIKRAGAEYLASFQDLLEWARELPESEIPDELQIVPPQTRAAGDVEVYFYEIPAEAGLDPSIEPHAALGADWLVFSYCREQSADLFGDTRPQFSGPLRDSTRPLMAAAYYDNHQLIDALYDWAKYGMQWARLSGESWDLPDNADSDLLAFTEAELMEACDAVVDLIKCFHGVESAGYMKDGAQVSEFQMFFQDK